MGLVERGIWCNVRRNAEQNRISLTQKCYGDANNASDITEQRDAGTAFPLTGEIVGFQMCPPESRRRLARFIHYLCKAHPGEITELIINGNFVNFHAEEVVTTDRPSGLKAADTPAAVEKLPALTHQAGFESERGLRIANRSRDSIDSRMEFKDKNGAPLIIWSTPEEIIEAWKQCSHGRSGQTGPPADR
jgi:hypothetical protein